MKTLKEICNYVTIERDKTTDKFDSHFARIYFNMFENKRTEPGSLLEIGINRGGSLLFWKDFLVNFEIYGIDILPRVLAYKEERINTALVDQGNKDELLEFAKANGPFDIIIDDGSHLASHQVTSFEALWPFVKNGGVYIVEDICVALREKYKDLDEDIISYFKRLNDINVASVEILEKKVLNNGVFDHGYISIRKKQ